jgi:D-beta-D-heptose 7-phosphate kinase/D-beta-D-heptose 1-phosphate adenosyltransferase
MSARPLVIVGDVLLDVDVLSTASRLTPDAPVPVLDEYARRVRPGGAALAALLAARTANRPVILIAPLADDSEAQQVCDLLGDSVRIIALPSTGRTPVKTRLLSGQHVVARLDSGGGITITELPPEAQQAMDGAAAVLVSDYGVAVTKHPGMRDLLARTAMRIPMVWDPHPRGGAPVAGVALVTPNAAEAAAFAGLPAPGGSGNGSGTGAGTAAETGTERDATLASAARVVSTARAACESLLTRWGARAIAVTLGPLGALICVGNGGSQLSASPFAATGDTCGAGDCFAGAAAAALADGALIGEAVAQAVSAATAFVASGAAGSLQTPSQVDAPDRAVAANVGDEAERVVARIRAQGGTVVATGGCFDLLHAGHIQTLAAARSLGDCLIVCLNSDASVRRLKGAPRPLQSAIDRSLVLAELRSVDAVITFEEDTPLEVLARLRPDVWVKGGDYTAERLPEADLVRSWGGEIVTVGYLDGRSTSSLVMTARA